MHVIITAVQDSQRAFITQYNIGNDRGCYTLLQLVYAVPQLYFKEPDGDGPQPQQEEEEEEIIEDDYLSGEDVLDDQEVKKRE